MRQTETLIPPTIPYPDSKRVPEATLGRNVVEEGEKTVYHDFMADQLQRVTEQATILKQQEVLPRQEEPVGRKISKFKGELATPEEERFINHASSIRDVDIDSNIRFAHYNRDYQAISLKNTRARLRNMDLDMYSELGLSLYCNLEAPKFFTEIKRQEAPESSWRTWLSDGASDEHLTNFLQWHVDAMERKNADPERQRKYELSRKSYKAMLSKGIEEGWLSPDAEEAIQKVDDIKIYQGDIFDTFLRGTDGYHRSSGGYIVVTGFDQGIVDHEENHAVLGSLSSRWRKEAATEHIVQAGRHGQPDVMDPAKRSNDSESYAEERGLYSDFLGGLPAVSLLWHTRRGTVRRPTIGLKRL